MKIFVIFDCDEWKTTSSFRLICVCDEENLTNILAEIKADHEYTDEEMDTYIYIESTSLNQL